MLPPLHREPALLRVLAAAFAFATLALLLAAAWLRFLVPSRQPVHVRDVRWLPPAGR